MADGWLRFRETFLLPYMSSPLSRFFQQYASALPEPRQLSYQLPAWIRFDLPGRILC